jgi:uncharacterized protein (DUF488 family)
MKLLTVGHGTASAEEFAALIKDAGVKTLVDVRSVAKSRRHPQFWSDAMAIWLPQLAACAYEWHEHLGGFRRTRPDSQNVAWRHPAFRGYADYMETQQFHEALASLLGEVAKQQTAIMCSETLWWRCHRRLISDAAVLLHNVEVFHLFHNGKLVPHLPTKGARILNEQQLRYDAITDDDGER